MSGYYNGRPQRDPRKPRFVSEKWMPCPDCNLRDDLTASPDLSGAKRKRGEKLSVYLARAEAASRPLKIRGGRQSSVRSCETCGGSGRVLRESDRNEYDKATDPKPDRYINQRGVIESAS